MSRQNIVLFLFLFFFSGKLIAQTARIEGIREQTPAVFAFTNADIVTSPGKLIRGGTLVIRNGIIEDVGRRADVPADAWVYDLGGKMIYPGFIDLYSYYGLPDSIDYEDHIHWNKQIRSHYRGAEHFMPDKEAAEALRSQGFVIVHSVPRHGLIRGYSTIVSLGDTDANRQIIRADAAMSVSFRRAERRPGNYPTSVMGAIALIRQTFLDAKWYEEALEAFNNNPALERPEQNIALKALVDSRQRQTAFLFNTDDENFLFRADAITKEFGLNTWIRGSGKEYRRLDAIRQTGLPVIVPLNFPETPAVNTPDQTLSVSLEDLRHWYFAPENPGKLAAAKVPVYITSHGANQQFLENLRTAVERGLSQQDALTALTVGPARKLNIDARYGSLEKGKAASFFITNGNIFDRHTNIEEVWVDGARYPTKAKTPDARGTWEIDSSDKLDGLVLKIYGQDNRLRGTIEDQNQTSRLEQIKLEGTRITFSFKGDSLGLQGVFRLSANVSRNELLGSSINERGVYDTWMAHRTDDPEEERKPHQAEFIRLPLPERFPSMEYGVTEIPEQPRHVLVRNATIWTQSNKGVMEDADMLITRGVITRIGHNLDAPLGAVVINADGMHVTPGLIDPHLHTSITGGVNETGSAITSETRIADVIHGDNVWIYRLLAGGITSATLFHGSANPIGGHSAVIKMRLGQLPEELLISDAAPGLKFALGENVKGMSSRYPNTRQGTEQIIKNAFRAAIEYEKSMENHDPANSLPLRRDLQLESILEVLRGERKAHVHAYRQDEMLMMMRLAEEYGFTIGSFEHTLEGYKIADELREHGAAAVVWTDWSSFKVEAHDGILYNARLLNDVGVLTSLHSDNTQLATRMNWEAAKTMKTGVSETDALNLITMNPAKIMGIDHRTGSLENGKDADFVIWNGHPLSSFSIPQQTWVDGRKYFDRDTDLHLRQEVNDERTMIINHIFNKKNNNRGNSESQ